MAELEDKKPTRGAAHQRAQTTNNYIHTHTMKNYSRQMDKFMESKPYANSSFRQTDGRTWVSYYIDENQLIHSSTFNYSIIGCNAVTEEQFKKRIEKDIETKVSFV